jgi:hypothetical protein
MLWRGSPSQHYGGSAERMNSVSQTIRLSRGTRSMETYWEIPRFSPSWNLRGENGKLPIERNSKIRLSPDKSLFFFDPWSLGHFGAYACSIQHGFGCTIQPEFFF